MNGEMTMPSVYNWQIGREMPYPHEERHPQWQFVFVFNINRCIGCQTCTMACKSTWTFGKGQELMWWNNVESKPFGGYPQNWDSKLLNMLEEVNPGRSGRLAVTYLIHTKSGTPSGSSRSCSTLIAASAARPARWPARAPGPLGQARN